VPRIAVALGVELDGIQVLCPHLRQLHSGLVRAEQSLKTCEHLRLLGFVHFLWQAPEKRKARFTEIEEELSSAFE